MVTLILAGANVELHEDENFNKVRSRINQALTGSNHQGEKETNEKHRHRPLNKLTFFTDMGDGEKGRIAVNPEKIIGIMSDEEKDPGNVRDETDVEDDEEEDDDE